MVELNWIDVMLVECLADVNLAGLTILMVFGTFNFFPNPPPPSYPIE
jgi:hypothetical protein